MVEGIDLGNIWMSVAGSLSDELRQIELWWLSFSFISRRTKEQIKYSKTCSKQNDTYKCYTVQYTHRYKRNLKILWFNKEKPGKAWNKRKWKRWQSGTYLKQTKASSGLQVSITKTYRDEMKLPYIRKYSAPSNNLHSLILGEEILKNNKNGYNYCFIYKKLILHNEWLQK